MKLENVFIKITHSDGSHKYINIDHIKQINITSQPGQQLLLTTLIDGKELGIAQALVVLQTGNDLTVIIEGGTEVVFTDYARGEEVSLLLHDANDQAQEILLQDETALDDEGTLLYTQGDTEQLMELLEASHQAIQTQIDDNGLAEDDTNAEAEDDDRILTGDDYMALGSVYGLIGAVALLPVALAGLGGGSGSSSGDSVGGFDISGLFTGGPATAGNDLVAKAYDQDGNKIGQVNVDADGRYVITAGDDYSDYTGPIVIVVYSSDNDPDYIDEGTGDEVNLSTNFRVITYAHGEDIVANTNALTEIATRQFLDDEGMQGNPGNDISLPDQFAAAEPQDIAQNNQAIARAFGLDDIDIVSDAPVATNDEDFASESERAQNYGRALAALSGLELLDDEDTSDVLQDIVDNINDGQLDSLQAERLIRAAELIDEAENDEGEKINQGGNAEHYEEILGLIIEAITLSEDSGEDDTDFVTKEASQTITATLLEHLAASERLYGRLNAGEWQDITDTISDNTDISWDIELVEGAGTIELAISSDGRPPATDGSNLIGRIASESYTLDSAIPDAPEVELANDSGEDDSDGLTNDGSIELLEDIADDEILEYRIQFEDGDFSEWTSDYATPEVNGNYQVQVRTTDLAGNSSEAVTISYRLDILAAAAQMLELVEDTGTSDSDGITRIATVNVPGIESGATWEYRIDDGEWQEGTASSFDLIEGGHSYQMRQTDPAGNVSAVSNANYTLDTQAPILPSSINVTEGSLLVGNIISNADIVEIDGGADAELFEFDSDGNLVFLAAKDFEAPDDANNDGIYEVRVSASDNAGNESSQTIMIHLQNQMEEPVAEPIPDQTIIIDQYQEINLADYFSDPDYPEDDPELRYRATNLPPGLSIDELTGVISGTATALTSSDIEVRIRVTDQDDLAITETFMLRVAPAISITDLLVSDDNIVNAADGDEVTVSGTTNGIDDGAIIEITINGTTESASVMDGVFSITFASSILNQGFNEIAAQLQSDNDVSLERSFEVDTQAPEMPDTQLSSDTGRDSADGITTRASLTTPTNIEEDAELTYSISVDGGEYTEWTSDYTVPTEDGEYIVRTRQTDTAGNASDIQYTYFTLDTEAPTVESISLDRSILRTGDSATLTVVFSEKVYRLTINDFEVHAGELDDLETSDDGRTWTATFEPDDDTEDATNVIRLIPSRVNDVAGNAGTGVRASTENYAVDTVDDPPTLTILTRNDLVEDAAATVVGATVVTYETADEEEDEVTVNLTGTNTSYYELVDNGDGTGSVTLTQAGVDFVNAGNDLPAFTLTPNDGSQDGAGIEVNPEVITAPVYQSSEISGTDSTITVSFDQALNGDAVPNLAAFSIAVGGTTRTVMSIDIDGQNLTLTYSGSPATDSEQVNMSYSRPGTGSVLASADGSAVDDMNYFRGADGDETLSANSDQVDVFVVSEIADGNDSINDFSISDGDLLDLSALLDYTDNDDLTDYLTITDTGNGNDVTIEIDADGSGGTDITLTLVAIGSGSASPLADLEASLIVI